MTSNRRLGTPTLVKSVVAIAYPREKLLSCQPQSICGQKDGFHRKLDAGYGENLTLFRISVLKWKGVGHALQHSAVRYGDTMRVGRVGNTCTCVGLQKDKSYMRRTLRG